MSKIMSAPPAPANKDAHILILKLVNMGMKGESNLQVGPLECQPILK